MCLLRAHALPYLHLPVDVSLSRVSQSVFLCLRVRVYSSVCLCVSVCLRVSVSLSLCFFVSRVYASERLLACVHVCVFMCACVCMYVCSSGWSYSKCFLKKYLYCRTLFGVSSYCSSKFKSRSRGRRRKNTMVVGAATILGKQGMGPETEVKERGKRRERMAHIIYCSMACVRCVHVPVCLVCASVPGCVCLCVVVSQSMYLCVCLSPCLLLSVSRVYASERVRARLFVCVCAYVHVCVRVSVGDDMNRVSEHSDLVVPHLMFVHIMQQQIQRQEQRKKKREQR